MTHEAKSSPKTGKSGRRPALRLTSPDDAPLRVTPAAFSRMIGVSKQSVSKAIQAGRISPPGADGKLDPERASREYLNNTHPMRIRAHALRSVADEAAELRATVQTLTAEVQRLGAALEAEREHCARRVEAATFRADEAANQGMSRVLDALRDRWPEAMQAHTSGEWERWIDELVAVEAYGFDLAEYRRERDEDAAEATPAP